MTLPTLNLTDHEMSGTYAIDPAHSRIGFIARHAMVTKVRGSFDEFDGQVVLDFVDPSKSTAEINIQVASIDTRQAQRDEHLRTNDFFDAATFPQITFSSSSVEQVDAETFRVTGDLTIKGTTKPVTVDFEYQGAAKDPYGNVRVGFEGQTTINRTDFGVSFNAALETGGVLVGEKIPLEFEISAVKGA